MRKLLMVTGAKGSGKTTVSDYIVKKHGFEAIRNEDLYVALQREQTSFIFSDNRVDSVYELAEKSIRNSLGNVVYEATGANPQWLDLYRKLSDFSPVAVRVECPFRTALDRHLNEDKTGKHVAPDIENHAREIWERLQKSGVQSDFIVDNSGPVENTYRQVDDIMHLIS